MHKHDGTLFSTASLAKIWYYIVIKNVLFLVKVLHKFRTGRVHII